MSIARLKITAQNVVNDITQVYFGTLCSATQHSVQAVVDDAGSHTKYRNSHIKGAKPKDVKFRR